jgi:hypothetical protein
MCPRPLIQPEGGVAYCDGCGWGTPKWWADHPTQDLFAARQARDEALERVTTNAGSYANQAIGEIKLMRGTYIGEEIRLAVEEKIGKPHHANAWGGIINTAVRQHLLLKTGRWRQMKTKKSHARESREYTVAA